MTAITTEPDTSPLTALRTGQCSPGCLLSQQPSNRCRCRCEGTHHGILLDTLTHTQPAPPVAAKPQKPSRAARRRHRKGHRT
jgi:hypothetical protein